ncbi:MAG: sulfatase, partial [Mailhella sp.]|nr:sulfatase [Mailhella sp.]
NKYSWAIYTEDWSYIHWVKANVDTTDMSLNFYGAGMDTSHLQAVGGKAQTSQHMNGLEDAQKGNLKNETGSEVEARHKATLTLDGEEQWTCTPGSKAEVPDYDELYDIHSDPFQLNNVISDHPDVAAGLLKKLTAYIEDLQNS